MTKRRNSGRTADESSEPPLLTRRQLAAALDKHEITIIKWQREGLPIAKRGGRGRASLYSEAHVRAWLKQREEAAAAPTGPLDLVQERARKEHWQGLLAEQMFLVRARKLLPAEEVERVWMVETNAIRTKLMAWPATLADRLFRASTLDGLAGVERELNAAVRDVLRDLAVGPERRRRKKAAA